MIHPGNKVQEILGRAIVDREFREILFSDREAALAAFDPTHELQEEDFAVLDGISRDQIEAHSQGITFTPSAMIWSPKEGDEPESTPQSVPPTAPEPSDPIPKPDPKPEPKPEPEPKPDPKTEPPTAPTTP